MDGELYLVMQYGVEVPSFMTIEEDTIKLTEDIRDALKITECGHTLSEHVAMCRAAFPSLKFISIKVPDLIFGAHPKNVIKGVFFNNEK